VIAAAALATFIALFLTSRPYDPMNSTVVPQQVIPEGPVAMQPSPKQSPTPTSSPQSTPSPSTRKSPEPTVETTVTIPDDASIQSQIEKILTSDPVLSQLDVSTLVENGRVTVVGSVHSPDMKQRVERAVRSVKGVISVDNQLVVTQATP
jgi:hyperosmotically inducible protein